MSSHAAYQSSKSTMPHSIYIPPAVKVTPTHDLFLYACQARRRAEEEEDTDSVTFTGEREDYKYPVHVFTTQRSHVPVENTPSPETVDPDHVVLQTAAESGLTEKIKSKPSNGLGGALDRLDRVFEGIVPVMPYWAAGVLAFVNVLIPGIGTIIAGIMAQCFPNRAHWNPAYTTTLNVVVGILQLFSAVVVIGWLWSIVWSLLLLQEAGKYDEVKEAMRAEKKERRKAAHLIDKREGSVQETRAGPRREEEDLKGKEVLDEVNEVLRVGFEGGPSEIRSESSPGNVSAVSAVCV